MTKKEIIIKEVMKNPFITTQKLADIADTTISNVRRTLSVGLKEEGLPNLKAMRKLAVEHLSQIDLDLTDFFKNIKEEDNMKTKIKRFGDLQEFVAKVAYDNDPSKSYDISRKCGLLWEKWFEDSEDADNYFEACDELEIEAKQFNVDGEYCWFFKADFEEWSDVIK